MEGNLSFVSWVNKVNYCFYVRQEKKNTAGTKAPQDVLSICEQMGMVPLFMPAMPTETNKIYHKLWLAIVCTYQWIRIGKTLKDGDIVVYQHPMYGNRVTERFVPRIQRKKHCRFIAVIHDLESLRKGIEGVVKDNKKTNQFSDNILLKHFNKIICHNEHMREYLIDQGFASDCLVNLNLFDYLTEHKRTVQPQKGKEPSISIAGNLAVGKCAYIYDIYGSDGRKNSKLCVHLYGNNFDQSAARGNMIYHGSFEPEEIPAYLEGDFGLVWDGNTAATCSGNTGEYLKYNNPHKASLYLAADMPVIVWSQAAIADFVLDNGIGIAVDSLYELYDVICNISEEEYEQMCKKAACVGEKVRNGYFLKTALNQCMNQEDKHSELSDRDDI